MFDYAVGVRKMHRDIACLEKFLHFCAYQMPVGFVSGVRRRLVHVRYYDVARVRTDQPFHFLRLLDSLCELCTPHFRKQRKIRLRHKTETVTPGINLVLYRPLGKAQKIHVAELGK